MPADSDPTPPLPRTYRPLGVRFAIIVLGALLFLVAVVMWLAFPPEIRDEFNSLEIGTVILLGLLFYAGGYALARSRLVAREDGLTVVNGYRTRRFEWNEILGVSLRAGNPWAMLDLSDGTSVAAMGIQGSDGDRAVRQVRQVRALIDRLTR